MTSGFGILAVGLVIAAGVAVMTKPDRDGFAPELFRTLDDGSGGGVESLIARGLSSDCREEVADCADLMRVLFRPEEVDAFIGHYVTFEKPDGDGELTCVGAYATWKCFVTGSS